MITLGPDSKCDVCLDSFDRHERAPCSIECGHVFCVGCLSLLSQANCPLCRSKIGSLTYIKLHVDWDPSQASSSKEDSMSKPEQPEALRLMNMISEMANQGSTETQLVQLIQGLKTFLSSQPRDQYLELRICHRMIKYIYDYKLQARSKQHELKSDLQTAHEAKSAVENRLEEFKVRTIALEDELIRSREQHREALRVIERLSRVMESLSMRPSSTDEGWVPRNRDAVAHSNSANFIISPLPELALSDLPDVLQSSPSSSEQSDVEKHPDVHDSGSSSPSSSSDEDESDGEQQRARSSLGLHSVLAMSSTSAPRRSYQRQVSPSPASSTEDPDALPLQHRLHDLLSDSAPHDAAGLRPSPSPMPPLFGPDSPGQREPLHPSRAPSRSDQLARPAGSPPAAVANGRSRTSEEAAPRASPRYTTLPPATSASAAAQQALERMQRQAQLKERERSKTAHEEDASVDRRRSSSRGDPESLGYRMTSSSSQSVRQPTPRTPAQPTSVSTSTRPVEPTAFRTGHPYSSHSGSVRQTSASSASRPPSQYYSASSTIARSKSGSMGRTNT